MELGYFIVAADISGYPGGCPAIRSVNTAEPAKRDLADIGADQRGDNQYRDYGYDYRKNLAFSGIYEHRMLP